MLEALLIDRSYAVPLDILPKQREKRDAGKIRLDEVRNMEAPVMRSFTDGFPAEFSVSDGVLDDKNLRELFFVVAGAKKSERIGLNC